MDYFLQTLVGISGRPVPQWMMCERDRLMDRLLDVHSVFLGKRVVLAGEPDWLAATRKALASLGVDVVGMVSPVESPHQVNASSGSVVRPDEMEAYRGQWLVGDFDDLENLVRMISLEKQVHLWLSNTHGVQSAMRVGVPFYSLGFPVWDRFGVPNEPAVGYEGICRWMTALANVLISCCEGNRGIHN